MKNLLRSSILIFSAFLFCTSASRAAAPQVEEPAAFIPYKPSVGFKEADSRAKAYLAKMTLEEKCQMISGHNNFFVKGFPQHGIPEFYMTDATAGVHLRDYLTNPKVKNNSSFQVSEADVAALGDKYVMEKSVAFPAPVTMAASWNRNVAYEQAKSISEECRAGNVAVLLGPGMNIYWTATNGRNFEYLGEDPYLAARMVENYVIGMQNTGTMATLKHFVANNFEYKRRMSNAIIGERALNEIYLPAFKAGVDAGAMAVMTSYNKVNDEWCGQSTKLIKGVLRTQLGFKNLVMSDWASLYDAAFAIRSGQDLEMSGSARKTGKFPFTILREDAPAQLRLNKVKEADIDRMCTDIMRSFIMMGMYDRPVKEASYLKNYPAHEAAALNVAREGIVLLRNDKNFLPVKPGKKTILLTGEFADKLPYGGGSAEVKGYDNVTLRDALSQIYGAKFSFEKNPTDAQLKKADVVIVSVGTYDKEGADRPFALPDTAENKVLRAAALNPNTMVIINSGGGIRMSGWNEKVKAIVHGWYPGQLGNVAVAEILSGSVNPSGKLPISIEKEWKDAASFDFVPKGPGQDEPHRMDRQFLIPQPNVPYKEGVFVGYRWYESQKIEPLYAFGFGLSYTKFAYSDLKLAKEGKIGQDVVVEFKVRNTGKVAGKEAVQLYVKDDECSLPRPNKELKAFYKVDLKPGETKSVRLTVKAADLAFYNDKTHKWTTEAGNFTIFVGGASNNTPLSGTINVK